MSENVAATLSKPGRFPTSTTSRWARSAFEPQSPPWAFGREDCRKLACHEPSRPGGQEQAGEAKMIRQIADESSKYDSGFVDPTRVQLLLRSTRHEFFEQVSMTWGVAAN
jgi:hypothetical protein